MFSVDKNDNTRKAEGKIMLNTTSTIVHMENIHLISKLV